MRAAFALLAVLAMAGCGNPTTARSQSAPEVTWILVNPRSATPIDVRSAAIGAGGRIAARNTAYGANLSLPVTWTAVSGAKSYAIILEDPDAPGAQPFTHWLIWNIPAAVTQLAEGAPAPTGAAEGVNGMGGAGYFGPRPPGGTHHYHLQVFALDETLPLAPGSDSDALAKAISGHLIAFGEVVGLASPPGR